MTLTGAIGPRPTSGCTHSLPPSDAGSLLPLATGSMPLRISSELCPSQEQGSQAGDLSPFSASSPTYRG